jgi:hypothetical protein
LDRATSLARVFVSQDVDLLAEAAFRQRSGRHFAGLIFASQGALTVRQFIDELQLLAEVLEGTEMINHVEYLPLKM